MISADKVILQPKALLHASKPSFVVGRHGPSITLADDDTPAVFVIRNDGKRHARVAPSGINHFLNNEPTQIDAGNALLRQSNLSPNAQRILALGRGFKASRVYLKG